MINRAVLLCSTFITLLFSARVTDVVHIPRGRAADVDGMVAPHEWEDAESIEIAVDRDWTIRVRFKRDNQSLYFAFEGVKHGSHRLFPEIFVDPQNRKSSRWEKGQWWLHISYNLCEGDGEPNVYRTDGTFQCSHQKEGWAGTNPPAEDAQVIEVRVSLSKLGISPTPGRRLGLAFAVTNATGDERQEWFFWPRTGKVDSPRTWGEAVLD